MTCPTEISTLLSVMNTNITLNKEQQRIVNLLSNTCKKVKLFDHNGLATCRCLIEDQKVIDFYLTETEAIASYNDATDLDSSEDSYQLNDVDENVLNKLFSRVANADQYINTLHNKQYVQELQEFLK